MSSLVACALSTMPMRSLRHAGEPLGGERERLVHRRRLAADARRRDAIGVDLFVGEAPLVAHPELVDVLVLARHEAIDLAARVVHFVVAAGGAARAHRRRRVQLPRAHGEAEVLRGQRADGADVDGVDRVGIVEAFARRDGELLAIAAIGHLELVLLCRPRRRRGCSACTRCSARRRARSRDRGRRPSACAPCRCRRATASRPTPDTSSAACTRRPCRRSGNRPGGSPA